MPILTEGVNAERAATRRRPHPPDGRRWQLGSSRVSAGSGRKVRFAGAPRPLPHTPCYHDSFHSGRL
jgi:hypothetical protein